MAHSAIRYKDNTRYIQDSLLGGVLRAIFEVTDSKVTDSPIKFGWLLEAIHEWWSDFEDMPPGLKDIELDKWLIDDEKKTDLEEILSIAQDNVDTEIYPEITKFIEALKVK
ncbi:hypothetical protein PAECIP111893_01971 [Paenibacillus plantiphilus]|uniref:Uncharacterized protein n=1 Tax=Paenibacillus plantiphilus TaxID=2905650 RepID=A0ABN8GHJ2_9BACL|nr:hypothetical protein [Paenibacillus plantiphilus]CAH1203453.1 hypothetical protein PAECIP111893_01971 [Paenibacillus plantiphilus]